MTDPVIQLLTDIRDELVYSRRRQLYGFYSNFVPQAQLSADPKRLVNEDLPCDYIFLYVGNTLNEPGDPAVTYVAGQGYAQESQFYWGFDNVCPHQLFPAQQLSVLIPCTNAREIYIRTDAKKGGAGSGTDSPLGFSLFKYQLRDEFLI